MRPMIDLHLDLSWSAMYFNRDLLKPIAEIRQLEHGLKDEPGRGRNTVSFPELRRAGAGFCVATLLARSGPGAPIRGSNRANLDYAGQTICHAHAKGQLAYYRALERLGHVRIITNRTQLRTHWTEWLAAPDITPFGLIISMEGADPILAPEETEHWWNEGLRAVGPVHYGHSHYATGTGFDGPLTDAGVRLLREFMRLGMILDVTHFADTSFFQALEIYDGPLWASHHNCRALVPDHRQLSDDQLRLLIQRKAVVGLAFDAWMLYPNWKRGVTQPEVVSLEDAANHVDHICQMAGNTSHCALGTDLDGGFGNEQTPRDLNTIADVHRLEEIFARRGYSSSDIDGIFFGNALRVLSEALPK